MFAESWLLDTFMWIINFSYVLAILPQIVLNYKIKSTKGLSDLYLVGYFAGYATNFFYVYCLNFYTAYKVRAIIAIFLVIFIIFQRFFYDKQSVKTSTKRLYTISFLIFLFLIPIVFSHQKAAGQIAGWALVFIWSLYQLPQVFKIYRNKSVKGFSFLLVSLIGLGNLVDLIISYFSNFPFSSFVIAIRGILIYFIFCFQFWFYEKKSIFNHKYL